ncbi:MAG: HTH domain-containing protein [Propionibacteriaceae bacterium]|nr:HTH domain-containing protein [Propionibacteriaceae bacterium]
MKISTRQRVLTYIAEHSWTTAAELADEFSLTEAAIRRHLAYLEQVGSIYVRSRPSAVRERAGRPAKEYATTTAGREALSHDYDSFAISAVEMLHSVGGEAAVSAFFEARFAAIEARFGSLVAANPALTEAEALSQALTEDGFMAGLLPIGSGEQLCQHNCPYPAVAIRFPQLCSVETAVFSRLLRSHVQRLATIAHGDGVCTTHIPVAAKEDQ